METPVYEKPEIKDLGTLQQLTANCDSPGSGDYKHVANKGFSTHSVNSLGYCTSAP